MTQPPCPAKAVLRISSGVTVVGAQVGAGAARAGTAADGVGAKAGERPLASDMDLDTLVGATEAGAMVVAAAGKLNPLTWQ